MKDLSISKDDFEKAYAEYMLRNWGISTLDNDADTEIVSLATSVMKNSISNPDGKTEIKDSRWTVAYDTEKEKLLFLTDGKIITDSKGKKIGEQDMPYEKAVELIKGSSKEIFALYAEFLFENK